MNREIERHIKDHDDLMELYIRAEGQALEAQKIQAGLERKNEALKENIKLLRR